MGLAGFGSRQKSSQSCVSQFSDIGNDGSLVSAIKIWYSRTSGGLAYPIPINHAIPKAPGKEGSMNEPSEYPEDAFCRFSWGCRCVGAVVGGSPVAATSRSR